MNYLMWIHRIGAMYLTINVIISIVLLAVIYDEAMIINASQKPVQLCAVTAVYEFDKHFEVHYFSLDHVGKDHSQVIHYPRSDQQRRIHYPRSDQRRRTHYNENNLMPDDFSVCALNFTCQDLCSFTSNNCTTTNCYGELDSNGYGYLIIAPLYDHNIVPIVYLFVSWFVICGLLVIPCSIWRWKRETPYGMPMMKIESNI
jgi:hypothetical protein